MAVSPFLTHLIGGAVGSSAFLVFAIIVGTLILEDPTTVIVGVLAADGAIPVTTGLFSLYAGIVLGDLGLYGLGFLASTHPRLARYVNHDFVAPIKTWLETRFALTVFTVRFIPGFRLPTYTASGFFRTSFTTFFLTAIGATSIWTTLLFYASYWFGNLTSEWLGPVRYGIAALFLLILFFVGRHNLKSYRVRKNTTEP